MAGNPDSRNRMVISTSEAANGNHHQSELSKQSLAVRRGSTEIGSGLLLGLPTRESTLSGPGQSRGADESKRVFRIWEDEGAVESNLPSLPSILHPESRDRNREDEVAALPPRYDQGEWGSNGPWEKETAERRLNVFSSSYALTFFSLST